MFKPVRRTRTCILPVNWRGKSTPSLKNPVVLLSPHFGGVVNSGRFGDREGVRLGRCGRENRQPVFAVRVLMVQIFQCYRTVTNRSELHEAWIW